MSTHYLHHLTPKALLCILRHVQLGKEHLIKKLPEDEFLKLLSIGSLSNNQKTKIYSDFQEKLGNASIVINTILTSCFGAWLGFNAFTQNSLTLIATLFIIVAAMSVGPATGYLSYLLTQRQAQTALINQQLCNVKRIIIEIIINKRKNSIELLYKKIRTVLIDIHQRLGIVDANSFDHYSLKQLLKFILQNRDTSGLNSSIEKKLLNKIERNFCQLELEDKSKVSFMQKNEGDVTDFFLSQALTNASYIKILTNSDLSTKRTIPKVSQWLKKNFLGVCVGLLPTLLGSFASMFVFLNGIPAFCETMNVNFLFSSQQIIFFKKCALLLASSVSLYFAYSHIHSNYKAFKRAQQLEISDNLIEEKTNEMLHLMGHLHLWTKIYYSLRLYRDLQPKKVMLAAQEYSDMRQLKGHVTMNNSQD